MRVLLMVLSLLVTLLPALAAAQAGSATTEELFTVELDFYRDGEPIRTEVLIGNRAGGSISAEHESLDETTGRPAMVIWATFHDPQNVPPAQRVAEVSPVWTAARRTAQRFTCNDVDLAVFNPAADTCRATVFWGRYELLGGGAIGELQTVTRPPRSACIELNTPATAFYNASADIDRLQAEIGDRIHDMTPDPALRQIIRGGDRPAEPGLAPLDIFQVMPDASILGTSPDGPFPAERYDTPPLDKRPLAIYDDRIVRYDASVLSSRTMYFVTMEFFDAARSINQLSFAVLDKPVLPLYSSLHQPLADMVPAPDPARPPSAGPALTTQFNYLVKVFSSDNQAELRGKSAVADLQQPFAGQHGATLPPELAAALQRVTCGELEFAIYYPGATAVTIRVQSQSIPAHFLVKEKGELLPQLINRLPGEIINIGEYQAGLATPEIGPVTLPADCRHVSDLGIATSSRQLLQVGQPGE